MKTRFAAGATLLLAGLTLGGCVTAPSSFYTLNATLPAAEKPAAPHPNQDLAVGIGPVRFPAFLDGPQIVARTTHNQLRVDEFHRWGGSLEDDFLRVLSENLGQLLGTSRILVEPAEVHFPLDFRSSRTWRCRIQGALGGAGRPYATGPRNQGRHLSQPGREFETGGHGRRLERDPIRLQS